MLKTIIIKPQEGTFAVVLLSLNEETLEVVGTETLLLTRKYPEAILEARKQRSLRGLEF
ncbi:MAG: hypothetical protein HC836_40225 [Richelia sp. RM2_1_2]|nr:hypothetical protein [Richelia sp. RM2_1_2]